MDTRQLLAAKDDVVVTIGSEHTVEDAVHLFAQHQMGALIVVDAAENLVGILSERDVVKGLFIHGPAVAGKPVYSLHSARVITCAPENSVVEIMALMDDNNIRHLPVVEDGHVVGVISQRDVMNAWLTAFENENERLQNLLTA